MNNMRKGIRTLGGGMLGAALGIATVAGWYIVLVVWNMLSDGGLWGTRGITQESMYMMGLIAVVWDGATGLLWGAGIFRPGFAKGWVVGASVRISMAVLILSLLPLWLACPFALIAPLAGGVAEQQ